jgi:WhiB family redox-sensing transcriptional regulator
MNEAPGPLRSGSGQAGIDQRRCSPAVVIMAGSWVQHAACRGTGLGPYFPKGGASATPAKAVCAQCPVRRECLSYALQNTQLQGVWGGTSDAERRALRSRAA